MTGSPVKTAGAGPRSVALIGPYGSGKSTLFDALMAAAGSPLKRPGDIRKRVVSTELRLGHCSFLGDRWSILDCPGSVEFAFETEAALAAVDLAIVVCEPMTGRASSVPLLLKALEDFQVPHLIFVNKIDTLTGSSTTRLQPSRRVPNTRWRQGNCRSERMMRWSATLKS